MKGYYFAMAQQFQEDLDLDRSTQMYVVLHDCLHVILGYGVSAQEEDAIGYIENRLRGYGPTWSTTLNEITDSLPVEFVTFYKQNMNVTN